MAAPAAAPAAVPPPILVVVRYVVESACNSCLVSPAILIEMRSNYGSGGGLSGVFAHELSPKVIAGNINSTNLRMCIVHGSVTVC